MCTLIVSTELGSKRKLETEESSIDNGEKQVVKEGMSWWTCFMLGMPHEQSKPHGVRITEKKAHGDYVSSS